MKTAAKPVSRKKVTTMLKRGLLVSTGALALSACNEDYSGPGSKWDISLNSLDSSFSIEVREDLQSPVHLTVDGTYQKLNSGFLRLDVVSASGTDAPTAGDQAWGLEVPGYALILQPIKTGSDQIVATISAGSCPTEDFSANWVIVKKSGSANADDIGRDFFGEFAYTASTESAVLPAKYALAGPFTLVEGADALDGGSCADGIMQVEDAVMYLTDNGGAIVHTGVNAGNDYDSSFIFALAQKAIGNKSNLNGNYAGVLFDESAPDGDKTRPVRLTCLDGNCMANEVLDVTSGQISLETVTISLSGAVDSPSAGFITGNITTGGVGNIACMADINAVNSGRNIISCVGQSPGDNSKMFNVIFASIES